MQPEAVTSGFIAAAHRGIGGQMAARFGLRNRREDCSRIAGGHCAAARRAHPIAERELPAPVTQFKGDIQRSGDGCILPVKGRARRVHLRTPLGKTGVGILVLLHEAHFRGPSIVSRKSRGTSGADNTCLGLPTTALQTCRKTQRSGWRPSIVN